MGPRERRRLYTSYVKRHRRADICIIRAMTARLERYGLTWTIAGYLPCCDAEKQRIAIKYKGVLCHLVDG
jgi:hypothetical protein